MAVAFRMFFRRASERSWPSVSSSFCRIDFALWHQKCNVREPDVSFSAKLLECKKSRSSTLWQSLFADRGRNRDLELATWKAVSHVPDRPVSITRRCHDATTEKQTCVKLQQVRRIGQRRGSRIVSNITDKHKIWPVQELDYVVSIDAEPVTKTRQDKKGRQIQPTI